MFKTNQSVHILKMAKGLTFLILEEVGVIF